MSISEHKHMPEPVRRMEVFTGRPAAKLVACGEDGDHCTKPVDFRKGAERLAALVRETMRTDPFSGVVYVFRAKRADRGKLIFWDSTGVVLVAKRLENGQFRWPTVRDRVMRHLLVVGVTAVVHYTRHKRTTISLWVNPLLERKPARLVTVA